MHNITPGADWLPVSLFLCWFLYGYAAQSERVLTRQTVAVMISASTLMMALRMIAAKGHLYLQLQLKTDMDSHLP